MYNKINIQEKLTLISDFWDPKIIGELNGQHIKMAKLKGEFVWHSHDEEDELFMVIQGSLTIQFRDKEVKLDEGEMLIVPKTVEHRPVAKEEVHILLFEPVSTTNTGNIINERTKLNLDYI